MVRVKTGKFIATGAIMNLELGFIPTYFKMVDETDEHVYEWFGEAHGQNLAHCIDHDPANSIMTHLANSAFSTYDVFSTILKSGTCDSTVAAGSYLNDEDGSFTKEMIGAVVHNTTDDTYMRVTGFVDATRLEVSPDYMINTETYTMSGAGIKVVNGRFKGVRISAALTADSDVITFLAIGDDQNEDLGDAANW